MIAQLDSCEPTAEVSADTVTGGQLSQAVGEREGGGKGLCCAAACRQGGVRCIEHVTSHPPTPRSNQAFAALGLSLQSSTATRSSHPPLQRSRFQTLEIVTPCTVHSALSVPRHVCFVLPCRWSHHHAQQRPCHASHRLWHMGQRTDLLASSDVTTSAATVHICVSCDAVCLL